MTAREIETRYPFKNLPSDWVGLFAPDNGVINVPLLLRTLLKLAENLGVDALEHAKVNSIRLSDDDTEVWEVVTTRDETEDVVFRTKKVILAPGAYINHVLKPSFGFSLDLDIWEMVASYWNVSSGANETVFPSMNSPTPSFHCLIPIVEPMCIAPHVPVLTTTADNLTCCFYDRHVVPVRPGRTEQVAAFLRVPNRPLGAA